MFFTLYYWHVSSLMLITQTVIRGQPIFYSRGAVKMMEKGYRANSLVSQCETFEITHDAGNQVLNWMYSYRLPSFLLYQAFLRGTVMV
jgi:hypothetical protein